MAQLFFEDVIDGMELPTLQEHLTLATLVMYCGAYEDFAWMHFDGESAARAGFSKPVVPGQLTAALLARLLTDWITPEGSVKSIKTAFRQPHLAGDIVTFKGRVTGKRVDGGGHLVDCEVWSENENGERCTPATAVIALPSRGM